MYCMFVHLSLAEGGAHGGLIWVGISLIFFFAWENLRHILAKRPKHKVSLQHQIVRNVQTLVRKDLLVIQKNVQVNCPWAFFD